MSSSHPRYLFLGLSFCAACGSRSALLDPTPTNEGTGGDASATSAGGSVSSASGEAGTTSQGGAGGAPPDTVVSTDASSQYETTTDLKVGQGGLLVVVWIAYPAGKPPFVGYTFSKDSGVTFSPAAGIECPDGLRAADPTLAIGPNNEVFLAWVGLEDWAESTGKTIFFARAAPGEIAFGPPSVIATATTGGSVRRPRLGITNLGTLFVTLRRKATNLGMSLSRSTDGITWTESALPSAKSAGDGGMGAAAPCAPADGGPVGRFGFAYTGMLKTAMVLTMDEGMTFVDAHHVADQGGTDPRCAVSADDSYAASSDPSGKHAYVSHSDGDKTTLWTLGQPGSPIRAGSPAVAMDSLGRMVMGYQVRVSDDDAAGTYNVLRFHRSKSSLEGGTLLWQVTLPLHTDPKSPDFMGSYTGIATKGNLLFTSYPDASSGASHIAIHRMEMP